MKRHLRLVKGNRTTPANAEGPDDMAEPEPIARTLERILEMRTLMKHRCFICGFQFNAPTQQQRCPRCGRRELELLSVDRENAPRV